MIFLRNNRVSGFVQGTCKSERESGLDTSLLPAFALAQRAVVSIRRLCFRARLRLAWRSRTLLLGAPTCLSTPEAYL